MFALVGAQIRFSPESFKGYQCEKCTNKEFFLFRIFSFSDWIRSESPDSVWIGKNTDQKELRIWTLFHAVTEKFKET